MTTRIQYMPHMAKCVDGKTRTTYVRSYHDGRRWVMHSDTFYSVPAYTQVKSKTVRGFIVIEDEEMQFFADRDGKNAHLLQRPTETP